MLKKVKKRFTMAHDGSKISLRTFPIARKQLKKVPEGSRRFQKVPEGLGRL